MTPKQGAKQIEGYDNYYIFDDGRLYSLHRGRFLKGFEQPNSNGRKYIQYILFNKQKARKFFAHVLVAHYFIGPRPVQNEVPMEIDHIDGNSLNNNINNLRYCTKSCNAANRGPQKNNSSGFKGVTKRDSRWYAQLVVRDGEEKKRKIHLGSFKSKIQAAKAYDREAYARWGEFAYLNFPDEV
tara:strand:- start:232 stop:780 length:549 start_codon:yes stop_codon:yes gene_type:complete